MTTTATAKPKTAAAAPKSAPELQIKILTISPAEAKRLLENNDGNRKLSDRLASQYAEDMRTGSWALNGETIKVCNTSRYPDPPLWLHSLVDGQHRLTACVKSKKPFTTAVAFVKKLESFATVDSGKRRSAGDVFSILGHKHSNQLAAALKLQVLVESGRLIDSVGGAGTTADIRNHDLEAELLKRPELIDSVEFAHRMKSKLKTRPACMAVAHYNLCKIDKQLGEECLTLFHTGEGLISGDPILAYRNFLIAWMQNPNNKLTNHYLLKGLYIMWNNWIKHKPVARVRVPKTTPLPKLKKVRHAN